MNIDSNNFDQKVQILDYFSLLCGEIIKDIYAMIANVIEYWELCCRNKNFSIKKSVI